LRLEDSARQYIPEPTGAKADIKRRVEGISFNHTKHILGDMIEVVFYDMTTLYFEASDEDDLRKTRFSKDGKHQCPQIFLGLLVGQGGNPIGYELFEGNIFEGNTFIPVLQRMEERFNLGYCNCRFRTFIKDKHLCIRRRWI